MLLIKDRAPIACSGIFVLFCIEFGTIPRIELRLVVVASASMGGIAQTKVFDIGILISAEKAVSLHILIHMIYIIGFQTVFRLTAG